MTEMSRASKNDGAGWNGRNHRRKNRKQGNNMKQIVQAAFVAAAVTTAGFTGAMAEEVKVGVAAEPYPPFTSPDASGKWVGWEIEFMEAICAEAKLDCVITPVAWDGIIPALTSEKIDMIVGSMSITEERLKTIDFWINFGSSFTTIPL